MCLCMFMQYESQSNSLIQLSHCLQVYKIYGRYFTGLLRWYKPPPGEEQASHQMFSITCLACTP